MTSFSFAPMETDHLQYSYGTASSTDYQINAAGCAGTNYRKSLTNTMLSDAKYFKENNLLSAQNRQSPVLEQPSQENLQIARQRSGNKLGNNRSFLSSDSSSASSRDWMTSSDDHRNSLDNSRGASSGLVGVDIFSYGDVAKSRRGVKRCSDLSQDCSSTLAEQQMQHQPQHQSAGDPDYVGENLDVGGLQGTAPVPRKAANARERDRTHSVNSAFTTLRTLIPTEPADRKLSKIETIRLATSYIGHLQTILVVGLDSGDQPCMTLHKSKRMLHASDADVKDDGSSTVYPKPICTFCLSASKTKTQSIAHAQPTNNCMYSFVGSGSSFI